MNQHTSSILSAPADESGSGTGGALTEAKAKISQTAREAASKVRSAVSDTTTRAKAEAERFASEKKTTAADHLHNYSSAVQDSARSLEEKDPNLAWFTHRAADKLQDISDYVRDRDFSTLRHDAEGLARRHPAAFFGGMFLAGLLLGNVVKASRRKAESDDSDDTGADGPRGDPDMEIPELTPAERSAAGI